MKNRIPKILNNIQSTFNLNEFEMCGVCHADSIDDLNRWFTCEIMPTDSQLSRLFDLSIIEREVRYAGYAFDRESIIKPVSGASSILDMLRAHPIETKQVLFYSLRLAMSEGRALCVKNNKG